jgi:hypothetical protein
MLEEEEVPRPIHLHEAELKRKATGKDQITPTNPQNGQEAPPNFC